MVKISKRGKKAWVTFTLPGEGIESAMIKGSWNGWEEEPMKRKKNGHFYIVKVLPLSRGFEFGYMTSDGRWIHDDTLKTAQTPFGSQNSILNT